MAWKSACRVGAHTRVACAWRAGRGGGRVCPRGLRVRNAQGGVRREGMATDVQPLVDTAQGLVSRRIFIEPEIYEQELVQIFARCWLFLCHESQIPQPGDFFSTFMGEDPVLVIRDSQGTIHAFLNVCRHRGNRLCRADIGNAATFTCAYHGWTYSNDGQLVGVPYLKEAYYGELEPQ